MPQTRCYAHVRPAPLRSIDEGHSASLYLLCLRQSRIFRLVEGVGIISLKLFRSLLRAGLSNRAQRGQAAGDSLGCS